MNRRISGLRALLVTALFMLVGVSAFAADSARQTLNFNREWKFKLGDEKGAEAPAFEDAQWSAVGLPHSFSTPYFLADKFYTGYGWYRKHFDVPAAWKNKRVSIEFEAAFQDAEVFVNGKAVGRHEGGYTGFSLDITDAVKAGDNVVAVRLNNLWRGDLAPRAGEHVFCGGIYRDVYLVVTDPLHVAWYGTFVTTPEVSKESATVNIKTEVKNDTAQSKKATVLTRVVDAAGKEAAKVKSDLTIAAGETAISDQTVPAIANPKLWHPDHPALYKALTTVSVDGKAVDTYETTFGIRSIKWTADQGMFLNGEHYYLRGANAHQDHAGWGDAVCNSGFTRDVQMLKDAGFNWIRGSHYPHAPAYLKACDEKGMLYWSENIFWGTGGKQTDGVWSASGYPVTKKDENGFEESVLRELGEMIRIHRNSPSVMAWSTSNEPFFSDSKVMDKVAALLKKEVEVIHQLDPTRSAAIGGCQRPTGAKRIDKLGDIAGYNGDGARIPDFQNPGIPSVVSEYGSVTAIRPGKYIPCWGSDFAKLKDGCPEEPAWRSGQAIWCAFDHGSIAGSSLGKMGIIDYFRVPKRAYYWYRNQYAKVAPPTWPEAGTPAQLGLKATSTELASTDGTEDARLDISIQDASGKLISNAVSVTLTIESGPGELPTGKTISFEPDPKADIPIIDGQAAIEFRSYYAGTTVIRATSAGLKDATIQIVSKGGPAYVKGKTPETQDRPYVHFTGAPVNASSGASTSLSLNRPTKASSMAQGAASSVANDGNAGTVWKAADNAADAWWQTFLENSYQVNRVQLVFPAEGNYRFQIQTSADGQTWKPVLDQSQTTDTDKTRTFFGNFGNAVGYVRVQFVGLPDGQPAALAEVTVGGGKDMTLDAAQLSGRIIGTPGSWKNDSACAMDAAMDGNQETFFDAAQESGAWVGLDLGTPQGVAKVRYCPRKELPQRMVGGKFQGANKADFSDAVDLFTVSVAPADGKMTEQKIENPAAFRYVRYVSPDNGSCNIAEMEFCGLGK